MVKGSKSLLLVLLILILTAGMPGTVLAGEEVKSDDDGFYRPSYLEQIKSYLEKIDTEKEKEKEEEKDKGKDKDDEDKGEYEEGETIAHRVSRGETISGIASRHQVSVENIASSNQLNNPHQIKEGDILIITRGSARTHLMAKGDTIWDIAQEYGVSWRTIMEVNEIDNPGTIAIGTELVVPLKDKGEDSEAMVASASGTVPAAASDPGKARAVEPGQQPASSRRFIWPVEGWISSPFGPRQGGFHYGLDIAASTGTPVRAVASGLVDYSGWRGGYGRAIIIDHGDGWQSLYGHASRLIAGEGEQVYQGQIIARVGDTGNATGPHLHLEIIKDGSKLNPKKYLPPR